MVISKLLLALRSLDSLNFARNIAGAIGGVAGPDFSGLVFDMLQRYKGAFSVALVLQPLDIAMVWVVLPGK